MHPAKNHKLQKTSFYKLYRFNKKQKKTSLIIPKELPLFLNEPASTASSGKKARNEEEFTDDTKTGYAGQKPRTMSRRILKVD